jgi:hypothetical protein
VETADGGHPQVRVRRAHPFGHVSRIGYRTEDRASSDWRLRLLLATLLHALAALLETRVAFGPQLLRALLLLWRQQRLDIAPEPRLLNRQVRLCRGELLARGPNPSLVHGNGFDGLTPGVGGGLQALDERGDLLPVLLHELPHLRPLRLGQLQLPERKHRAAAARTARPVAAEVAKAGLPAGASAEAGALRVHRPGDDQGGDEPGEEHETKASSHQSTSWVA